MNSVKLSLYRFLIMTMVVLLGCKDREITNPFDSACPKEIFMPTDFKAEQAGNAVKLSWKQENTQISGFVINRNENDGTYSEVARVDKTILVWNDNNVMGGKKYGYQLLAYAGDNLSNAVKASITPLSGAMITTTAASSVTPYSAVLGGAISSDGGASVTERGVCYGTTASPTTANNKLIIGNGSGEFSNTVFGLLPNTNYYVKAYAVNSQGTAYGSEVSFTTYVATVTDIDGNIYHTVTIGSQVWMLENLRVTKYRDGSDIPHVTVGVIWGSLSTGAYCYHDNDLSYKNIYGNLYNWYVIADSRNICPTGWHVPDNKDWNILINNLGGSKIAEGKMKEAGTSHWDSPNVDATNSSGFTALPGGDIHSGTDYTFSNVGNWANFWSSTGLDSSHAARPALSNSNSYGVNIDDVTSLLIPSYLRYIRKTNGYSIRCVKD